MPMNIPDRRSVTTMLAADDAAKLAIESAIGVAGRRWRSEVAFVVGAQKAASTSLFRSLASSPSVVPLLRKEVDFFSTERYMLGIDWYRRQFAYLLRGRKRIGLDGSTTYLTDINALNRIARHYRTARCVYVVRDPFDRLRSHYLHNVRAGIEQLDFEAALEAESVRLQPAGYRLGGEEFSSPARHHYGYVRGSQYSARIADLVERGLDPVLVDFEDLISRPEQTVAALCRHLGVAAVRKPFPELNAGANDRALSLPREVGDRLEEERVDRLRERHAERFLSLH